MSLKERLRSKKEANNAAKAKMCEYKISINKVIKAIEKVPNSSDLGNIVKEFSKFLKTLTTDNAQITFSGSFDLGQKTLLNCVLSNFTEEEKKSKLESEENDDEKEEQELEAKLIKKRKAVRAKLKSVLKTDTSDENEENQEDE